MITRRQAIMTIGVGVGVGIADLLLPSEVPMYDEMSLLNSCVGAKGLWADPVRYRYQCWTRDFSLALQPVARFLRGGTAAAERHLLSLAARQGADGSIPILFLDGLRGHAHLLRSKVYRSLRDRKMSFVLKRYLAGELARLTPGTRDSELHFADVALRPEMAHLRERLTPAIERAIVYIERHLCDDRGRLVGCDWRDTMDKELGGETLLSNNAIWYRVLMRTGKYQQAASLREAMEERSGGLLADHASTDRYDPLGLSLGVLTGLIPPARYAEVLGALATTNSPRGVTIRCRHNAYAPAEQEVIDRTNGLVVWPFIVGYVVKACRAMLAESFSPARAFGVEQRQKLMSLGLAEWYDPATGQGYGSPAQGWTAALRVQVAQNI